MAQVTVPFEAYRDGELPAVCVISGRPADARVVLRTPPRRRPGPGGALDGLIDAVDVRRPTNTLLGRVPVHSIEWRQVETRRRIWNASILVGLALLVTAAWAGAAWSGPVAVTAAVLAGVGWWRRRALRLGLPAPVLIHGGSSVAIDNVHEAFAASLAAPDPFQ